MALANATNVYSNSRFIVGATNSPYTTIQSAINAANAAGGNATIWVRSGTYTENLILYSTVDLEGADSALTIIVGVHTPPAAGSMSFTRIGLNSATHILSSAAAGSTTLTFSRCVFNLTNGYICNLTNWTGALRFRYCIDNSTANGIVSNTGGSAVLINHCILGAGAGNTFTANGSCLGYSTAFGCPLLFNGTGTSKLVGGCDFSKNVATANTHTLTIGLCRFATGSDAAITHNSGNTLVLNECVINSTNATPIGGTGAIQIVSVSFPNNNAIAGTIASNVTGITRTGEIWADNLLNMADTGHFSWTGAGNYFDDTTLGTFQLLRGGTGYIGCQKVSWIAQNITGMTAGNSYFIYIDSTGTIQKTISRTDSLFKNNIVLFTCLRDSTPVTNNQITIKEDHDYDFQSSISNFLHNTAGIVIQNDQGGANITLNGTQKIQINGADTLNDHGLTTTIADSGGVGVTWRKMYTDGTGKWATQNNTDTFTGYWNSAGTPTALTANRFAVYRLYILKDTLNSSSPTYLAILDTQQYTTLANAQTAVSNGTAAAPSGELALLEPCQLGFIIYRQSTSTIVQVTISKATLRSSISTGGTNTASLINVSTTNFDGVLSSTDTNVQQCFDTIDEYRGGLYRVQATADGAMLSNRGYIVKNATPANLTTLTLPATPIQGDTIAVTGYTAGGWKIAQNANQLIYYGTQVTTTGVAGYIASSAAKDAIRIVCVTAGASAEWVVVSSIGNLTVN